jgi:hypothetical protein
MKSYNKQQGSAARIALITTAAVIVLGLFGFIFWQNFIKESDSSTTVAVDTAQPLSGPASNFVEGMLSFPDLGVKVSYEPSVDTYTTDGASEFNTYSVYSMKAAVACGDAGNIGTIQKVTASEVRKESSQGGTGMTNAEYLQTSEFFIVVSKGEFIYTFQSPQAACADASTTEGGVASGIAEVAYKAFAADFKKLEVVQ